MINIQAIISEFSKEEQQEFINYLSYKNKRKDVKNIALFRLLLQNTNQKSIPKLLYGKDNKTAYHALRKRLFASLIDFIATQSLTHEVSGDLEITKQLLVARNLLIHKQYKAGLKILDRAEKKAKEIHHFALLNEIYHTKIQYATTSFSKPLEYLIDKFNKNQQNLLQEEKLNIAYAIIKQQSQEAIQEGKQLLFKDIVNDTYKRLEISEDVGLTYKSLYQIIEIISKIADVNNDFYSVDLFIIENYKYIKEHVAETEKHLVYHIKLLYHIANIYFRKKAFTESQFFLNLMHDQMQKQNKKYYKNNFLKHQCLLALNENYSGNSEAAITILENVRHEKKYTIEVMLDIYLSLIVFYFQQQEYKKAQTIFSKFYHTDKWYEEKVGKPWTIKKNLIELLLHIELGNISYVDSRLQSIQRKYSQYLKKIGEYRVLAFINLVKVYYQKPEEVTSASFKEKVEATFEWKLPKQEDIFAMSFYAWLKAKMEQQPLYRTTLALVKIA